MSRAFHPVTVIPGASPQLDRQGQPVMGNAQPLKTADGRFVGSRQLLARPLYNMPQPLGMVSHWISEAARREHGGDMTRAKPGQLVQVPIYRGTDARFMNQIRSAQKHKKRMSLAQRIKAEIDTRFAKVQEGA